MSSVNRRQKPPTITEELLKNTHDPIVATTLASTYAAKERIRAIVWAINAVISYVLLFVIPILVASYTRQWGWLFVASFGLFLGVLFLANSPEGE